MTTSAMMPNAESAPLSEIVLQIDGGTAKAKTSPLHYGLMTEEINHCYDGGLYAELIQNRAFNDDPQNPVHWSLIQNRDHGGGTMALDDAHPLTEAVPISLRVESKSAGHSVAVANEGFWGIPVKPDTTYQATFHAKTDGSFSGPLEVMIESKDGKEVFAMATVPCVSNGWQKYTVSLTTPASASCSTDNRFVIALKGTGTVWLSLVSLFPPTWNGRQNGLRPDLMQMLVDLKPAFLRFPGGNYLEGDEIETRFDWKKTLGPLESRPGHPAPWQYRSSDGMGLMDFLLWCEDMGAEPVLGVYAGYSLRGAYVNPGPALEPYIQDALDEVEYITGPVTSKWGGRRAEDGHPEPFKLRYVEIGNEDWFDKSLSYDGRFAQFYDAFKKKHPGIKLISSIGNENPKEKRVQSRKPDIIDEHYYRTVEEFVKMAPGYYDDYDRNGPEIFVGEWAAHETAFPPWDERSKSEPLTPNMWAAIGDAVWMTAMERNADLVTMQCYAPLFSNVNPGASQWRPNLIGYDAISAFGSPSYYAFQMFSCHFGDEILSGSASDKSLPYSVTRHSQTGTVFVKLVNPKSKPQPVRILLDAAGKPSIATVATLAAAPEETNSLAEPRRVVPSTAQFDCAGAEFLHTLPPSSVTVVQFQNR